MVASATSTVVGVFHEQSRTQEAVRALRQAGFREEQISVLGRNGDKDTGTEGEGTHAVAGAATGAAAGAGIAALWSLGMSFGVVPVIGPILAAGPIAAALLSAAGGAAAGGLLGALVGMGIPEEDAKYYEGEVHAGRFLVTVHADGRRDEAWTILQRHGAYNRQTSQTGATSGTNVARGTTPAAHTSRTGGEQTVQVHEEQMRVHKTPVQAGEVRVHKEVHTQQQNIQVPVEREEVVIERRPASGRASTSDIRAGDEVRIPVREEQVHVDKEAVVKEEVAIGKRKVTDTQQVQGEVRKEEVKVEQQGDAKLREKTGSGQRR